MKSIIEKLKDVWQRSMMHRAMMVAPPIALLLWVGYVTIGAPTSAEYFTAKVDKGDISQVVQATGTINPVNTVAVGSVVSGNVVSLKVDFNSQVKKGDVLANIDPLPFQIALDQSKASYANAVANVANLEAQIATSQANVETMKANIAKAHAATVDMKTQYDRTKALVEQQVLSAQNNDDALANYDSAAANEKSVIAQEVQAEAQLKATIAQRDQAKAQVLTSQQQVKSAQLQLDYCTIKAPIDGTIINRTVNVGQPIAASLQAPNLFTVGQDLYHMMVYSNTDESDVGRIRQGARVTFRVDAFPRETFNGVVAQVRMNATTIQNVVTYNTMVAFDNPDLRLFPGMTAYLSIPVAQAHDVVKIPNGALRFKPDISDSERDALYAKYNVQEGRPAAPRAAGAAGGGAGAAAGGGPGAGAAPGGGGNGGGGRGQGGGQGGGGGRRGGGGNGGGGGGGRQNAPLQPENGIVWKLLPDKSIEPIQVGIGVTDFTYTTLLSGTLEPGDQLIIGEASRTGAKPAAGTASPLGARGGAGGPGGRF